MKIKQLIANFLKEEDGLTTVEYAIAGGAVTTGSIVSFKTIGDEVAEQLSNLATALETL